MSRSLFGFAVAGLISPALTFVCPGPNSPPDASPPPPALSGDFDNDGAFRLADAVFVAEVWLGARQWGTRRPWWTTPIADFDSDGAFRLADAVYVAEVWLGSASWGASSSASPSAPPPCLNFTTWSLKGVVQGVVAGDAVVVSVGSATGVDRFLEAVELDARTGEFSFNGLPKEDRAWVKLEGTGYSAIKALVFDPPSCANEAVDATGRRLTSAEPIASLYVTLCATAASELRGAASDEHAFRFSWQTDASRAGAFESAHIVTPPNVTFLDEEISLGDDQASDRLHHEHNILLANDEMRWSSEFAYRLLETIATVPQRQQRSFYSAQTLAPSKWTLTADYIDSDVHIHFNGTARVVRISAAAFVHATPQVVRLDGERGRFFSRRLHHAVVRFVTSEGRDTPAVQHIMSTRYGCTTAVSADLYRSLTAPTTAEDVHAFQPFETHAREPLLLLDMLEELPEGLHVVRGLSYLLRRLDGQRHPLYPSAAAVAWPTAHNESYVEFMESGMLGDLRHTRRLILHEKAHFLWSNLFSPSLRADWIRLAGWYHCAEAQSGWCTTQQTTFASPYAHRLNPNEDMAESISYYVENPARLLACCPAKYGFIRDRIMQGYRYVSRVRPDLTFQVLNLMPDYTYPGKIVRVAVAVHGAPLDDKHCTVEIGLHTLGGVFDGADWARFRLFSDIGTWQDVYLYPSAGSKSNLSNSFTLSRYAKAGLWRPQQIVLQDVAGNQRFAGVRDFGWRLHVDNPLEDVAAPRYVEGSLSLTVSNGSLEGHAVQFVTAEWLLVEDRGMKQWGGTYTRLVNDAPGSSTIGLQQYGYPGLSPAGTACGVIPVGWLCLRAAMQHVITPFRATANYSVGVLAMKDVAGNEQREAFTGSASTHTPLWVPVLTTSADWQPPTLDLNNISVSAEPTNPSAPNGETRVAIVYHARDDLSGLGRVSYRLLDPQGTSHFEYHYHDNFHTTFFVGDPTAWATYTVQVVLPPGSAPGTWGLESLELQDKVNNANQQSFVENVHFQLGGRRLAEPEARTPERLPTRLRFEVERA